MLAQQSKTSVRTRLRNAVELSSSVAVIVLTVTMVYVLLFRDQTAPAGSRATSSKPAPVPTRPVSVQDAWTKGDKDASVVMIEYADFQCPYCARFATTTLTEFDKAYVDTGKVLMAFRHFPLSQIHRAALLSAEAVECAGRQGHFWEMHDAVFSDQAHLNDASFRADASRLGLNEPRFVTCVAGEASSKIQADAAGARALLITSTPTFLIGSKRADGRVDVTNRFSGAVALTSISAIVDPLLSKSARP